MFETSGKRSIIIFTILFNISSIILSQEADDQLPVLKMDDSFKINSLLQSGFRYSIADDYFQGGRSFEVFNARLNFSGVLEESFFYRVFFNIADSPVLLDAYAGYRHSDIFRIKAGAMKPDQTLDFIPDPASYTFIDRSKITSLLVQSREIGISAEGDINEFYYFIGIFNGTGLSGNNNNRFYNIGRLQYTFSDHTSGSTELGINYSHGKSPGVRSGNSGPVLRGTRTIFGGDIKYETETLIIAIEYLAGSLEVIDIIDNTEFISGYYISGGYSVTNSTTVLIRWQKWGYKVMNLEEYQLTIGVNLDYTDVIGFRLNLDSYFPAGTENQYGISLLTQISF